MTKEKIDLVKDSVSKVKKLNNTDWTDIKSDYEFEHSSDNLRKYATGWKMLEDWGLIDYDNLKVIDNTIPNYKETVEIKADGTTSSDKLVRLTQEDMKTPEALIKAHGLDPNEWEMLSSRNSMWNQTVDKTLYYSRINVKPKTNGVNIEKLVDFLTKDVKPYQRKVKNTQGQNLLEIFLTDMHFGVNDFNYYKDTLDEVLELIESKQWDTIYIPVGSDLLHNDDFKGRTTNDTVIEKVDMEKAWEDAYNFYYIIYKSALENSVNVVSDYICGNHDKTMSYGLVKTFSKVFPQIKWDTSTKNKKLFTWKDVAILCMHGDKGSNRISKTIYKEYGKVIADKKVVEIHTGDKHHTKTDDIHGVVFRILPTRAKTDEWHEEQSFTGSMKCFHVFEYKEDMLKKIHLV